MSLSGWVGPLETISMKLEEGKYEKSTRSSELGRPSESRSDVFAGSKSTQHTLNDMEPPP